MTDASAVVGQDLDPGVHWVADLNEAVVVERDIRTLRRNWLYLTLLRDIGTGARTIDSIKPEDLRGAIALALLDGKKDQLCSELRRWALYFAEPLLDLKEYVVEIEEDKLRDAASIAEVARMSRELVEIADKLFEND
ncbi:hypothetical protein [Sinomonas flava]|uniref:Uncharacterized protein n=1 Tax=Sinomonas flava TaxID=496857 RepID=A0ABN3C2N5_9MICC